MTTDQHAFLVRFPWRADRRVVAADHLAAAIRAVEEREHERQDYRVGAGQQSIDVVVEGLGVAKSIHVTGRMEPHYEAEENHHEERQHHCRQPEGASRPATRAAWRAHDEF